MDEKGAVLIEVKLGGERLISEGKTRLAMLAKVVDATRMSEPSFRMVIVATGDHAYNFIVYLWRFVRESIIHAIRAIRG